MRVAFGRPRTEPCGMSTVRKYRLLNGLSPVCAAKQVPQCASTQCCGTLTLQWPATDHRAIEVLASGLPLHHGVQLAVDITIRCAHTVDS